MINIENINKEQLNVDELANYLKGAVKSVTDEYTVNLDNIINELSKGINLYSNQELWDFQVRLSIEAYVLGMLREQSSLKDACAEALYKEGLANSFNATVGTQEVRKQQSIIDSIDKQAVSMLWSAVSNLLKTKCDEAHRLVNVLQGIQISRAAEAKQNANPRSEVDAVSFMGGNN